MKKDINIGGNWNILGKRYDGTLIFNKSNGAILLSIYYIDGDIFAWRDKPLQIEEITGATNQKNNCILINCKVVKRSSENGRHHILIMAKSLFFGTKKRKKETLKFNKMIFRLKNIFAWTELQGFQNIFDKKYSMQIGYKFKDEISIKIDNGTLIEFVPYLGPYKYNMRVEDINLSQYVVISIEKEIKSYYEDFFEELDKVINLIMFATNEKVTITNIKCLDYEKFYMINDETKKYFEFEMIDNQMEDNDNKTKYIDMFYYLFNLPELVKENKIASWFNTYDKYKSIYDLYLLSIKNNVPNEIKFSNLMQAVELIHSNKYNKKKKFINHIKEKFKNEVEIIDEIIENKDQIESQYIILRSRLIDMFINEFDINQKTCIKNNIVAFSDVLTDSRNYYTHYNNSKKNKCVIKQNLINAIFILDYIVCCFLLKNLEFSDEYINEKLKDKVDIIHKDKMIENIVENKR